MRLASLSRVHVWAIQPLQQLVVALHRCEDKRALPHLIHRRLVRSSVEEQADALGAPVHSGIHQCRAARRCSSLNVNPGVEQELDAFGVPCLGGLMKKTSVRDVLSASFASFSPLCWMSSAVGNSPLSCCLEVLCMVMNNVLRISY